MTHDPASTSRAADELRTERRHFDDDGGGRSPWLWALVAALLLAGGGFWWWQSQPAEPPLPPPPLARNEPAPPAQAEPVVEHPLPAVPSEPPLPPLATSDALLTQALIELAGNPRLQEWLQLPGLARRIVATVDNLPRDKLPPAQWPLRPVGGTLRVTGSGESLAIDPANAARYAMHVKLLESIDVQKLVALYVRTYPLFQQAYAELGYPKAYFNDRVIQVIDHLLATPQPAAPLKLVQPKLAYEFADPQLQALSAGQKAMLRLGPEQAARVKARLTALREEILRNSERR